LNPLFVFAHHPRVFFSALVAVCFSAGYRLLSDSHLPPFLFLVGGLAEGARLSPETPLQPRSRFLALIEIDGPVFPSGTTRFFSPRPPQPDKGGLCRLQRISISYLFLVLRASFFAVPKSHWSGFAGVTRSIPLVNPNPFSLPVPQ